MGIKRSQLVAHLKKTRNNNLRKKVNKIAKEVRILAPEKKWNVFETSSTTDYTGSLTSLNNMLSQGITDFGTRVGDKIRMKSMVTDVIFGNSAAQIYPITYRVIMVQCKNNPDHTISNASQENLFLHSGSLGGAYAAWAPYDWDNRDTYRVLYDKRFMLTPLTGTTAGANCQVQKAIRIRTHFNNKNGIVQYQNASTTALTRGEVFLVIVTDASVSSSYRVSSKLYYTDV